MTVTATVGQSTGTTSSTGAASSTGTTSSTGTATATSGLVVPTGVLALDCPALADAGTQTITLGDSSWHFTPSCGTDFAYHDIGAVIVYSFHDCMQACAAHNHFYGENQCVVAHFSAEMTNAIANDYGNCWLKNATETVIVGRGNLVASAQLVT